MNIWPMTPQALGIPVPPATAFIAPKGRFTSYMSHMKVGIADWYFILWHKANIRYYQEHGGDMAKAVITFFAWDSQFNNIWRKFHDYVAQLKEYKVQNVVPPDFSAFPDSPLAKQINNIYKSGVVACDLAAAGIKLLPHFIMPAPQLWNVSTLQWGHPQSAIIPAIHFKSTLDERLFWQWARFFRKLHPAIQPIIYAANPATAQRWRKTTGGKCHYCVSRGTVLSHLGQVIRKRKRRLPAGTPAALDD